MYGLEDECAPWGQISGYMLRAQTLLRSRTSDEVRWGGVAVSWMLSEALPELQDRADVGPLPPVVPIGPSISELVRLRRHIPIDGMAYFPNASWPELLAAYAMDCIGQAHGAFQYKRELKELNSENQHEIARALDKKFLAEVFEAVEAVHHGERIKLAREVTQEAELHITEQQRDRGVKRHAGTRALLERFYVFYLTEGGGNRSQAARIFLKRLSPEDREEFTEKEEYAVRTLTLNLRSYLRDPSRHDEDEV